MTGQSTCPTAMSLFLQRDSVTREAAATGLAASATGCAFCTTLAFPGCACPSDVTSSRTQTLLNSQKPADARQAPSCTIAVAKDVTT